MLRDRKYFLIQNSRVSLSYGFAPIQGELRACGLCRDSLYPAGFNPLNPLQDDEIVFPDDVRNHGKRVGPLHSTLPPTTSLASVIASRQSPRPSFWQSTAKMLGVRQG